MSNAQSSADQNDILIVYPERRVVPDGLIEIWYADAVDNHEIDAEDWGPTLSVLDKARALDDAGIITIANRLLSSGGNSK